MRSEIERLRNNPLVFCNRVLNFSPGGKQQEFFTQTGRIRPRRCGRRFGKTTLTCAEVVWQLITNPKRRALIVGPSFDQARVYFEIMDHWIKNTPLKYFVKDIRLSPHREVSFVNESHITMRSAHAGGIGIRGRGYDYVVLTEAAYIPDDVVEAGVMPTTLEATGPVIYVEGTPWSTASWFYRVCQRYGEIHATVWDAPHLPRENIEALEAETDPYYWRVEYLAEWVDDTSSVFPFSSLSRCLEDYIPEGKPEQSRKYSMGVDLAKTQDYTAIMVVDITEKPYRIAAWEHFRGLPYVEVAGRVNAIASQFGCRPVVDATGVGDAVVEQIPSSVPVKFTPAVKENVISALRAVVERAEIKIPTTRIVPLAEEMKIIRQETRAAGLKIEAPVGKHDDCVIALALAVWGARTRSDDAYWQMRKELEKWDA